MKNMNKLIILGILIVAPALFAAFDFNPTARPMSMGGAFTALADDLNAPLYNPAGLVQSRKIGIMAAYDMRYLGIGQNIGHSYLGTALSLKRVTAGVSIGLDNFSVYREMTVTPTVAYSIDKNQVFNVGASFKLLNRSFTLNDDFSADPLLAGKSSFWNMSADAGFLFKPSDTISVGLSVLDLLQPNIALGSEKEILPFRANAGVLVRLRELAFAADVSYKNKMLNRAPDLTERFGLEYSIAKGKYALRTGYDVGLSKITAGASILFGFAKFDYGFNYQLNGPEGSYGSHALAVNMNFGIRSSVPGSISGRIVASESGAGVAEGTVKAFQGGKLVAKTVSSGDGSYRLDNLLEGYYDIEASGKGLLPKKLEYKTVYAEEDTPNISFRLYDSPGTITGKIAEMDNITGINGALVRVSRANGAVIGQAIAKQDGSYEVLNLPEGHYEITVTANKHEAKVIRDVFVNKGDILPDVSVQLAGATMQKIAVMPFNNTTEAAKRDDYGTAVANMFTTALFKTKKFNVIERENLEKVLKEQTLWLSGVVDEGSSKKIGQLTGVSFLVVGSVSKLGAFIELDARLIDTESGKVIQTGSGKANSEEVLRGAIDKLVSDMMKKF